MIKILKSKKPRVNSSRRYIGIFVFFVLACVVYSARLINIQISGQDYYSSGKAGTYQRREIIYAERGELFDRNGVPLVINEYTENIILDYGSMPYYNSAKNILISQALSVIRENGDSSLLTDLNYPVSGNAPDFYFDEYFFADQTKSARFKRILKDHGLSEEITCETFVSSFLRYYGLTDRNGNFIYSGDDVYEILARRFDMEYMRFSEETPYILAENADISLISSIKESFTYGVRTLTTSSRKYCFPGFASHILGRMGKIPAGSENEYLEKGYSLDSYVGISGAEAAFENYLRGQNGVKIVTEDEYGYIIDETIEKAPVSGQDVYLTIDINLQIVAEYALKNNIDYIVENAILSGVPLSGEDAKAGALSILEIGTNDVLALASYPSFNLATFNRDYSRLIANDTSPLLNRALNGMYTPGSTFKIATAAAALSEGVVSATQLINDTGKYTYYSDYQPACWIYNRYGFGHGFQNIVQAIQNSCNYYFFEAGRLLTIERLVDYCKKFGLGEKTGIELGETAGVLDCPEYREKSESDAWQVGDVLQVAIGQGKSMFSPLQLANYIATFITGERRSTHILSSVHQYGTDVVTFEKSAGEILDTVEISSYNRSIILSAMKNVVDIGSAASVFADYDITVGGKTGTAQVNEKKSENAIFVGFAPYDSPKIVASVVIEQGSSGTTASRAIRDVFDYYFSVGSFKNSPESRSEFVAKIISEYGAANVS
ncbi:MAG: hypothetical protein J5933_06510 [Clostridia bacterium]|nr:hypothetical protein [Clostridia bacterium]